MGEVVDMTGRVVVADEHPLGVESVRDVSIENRQILRRAWDEAPHFNSRFCCAPGSKTQNVSLGSPSASNAASRSVMGSLIASQVS